MSSIAPLVSVYDAIKKLYEMMKLNNPIGCIKQYSGSSAPNGWLLCKGQDVLKSSYPELYAIIGTTYGEPEDEDYFTLPNFSGRVPVGYNDTDESLSERTLGESNGEEEHVLTTPEMPSHTHTHNANATNVAGTALSLASYTGSNTMDAPTNGGGSQTDEIDLTANAVALVINSTGGGNAHNIMQPYLVVHYIIKYTHKYTSLLTDVHIVD